MSEARSMVELLRARQGQKAKHGKARQCKARMGNNPTGKFASLDKSGARRGSKGLKRT